MACWHSLRGGSHSASLDRRWPYNEVTYLLNHLNDAYNQTCLLPAVVATAVVLSPLFSVSSSTEATGDWLAAADATCIILVTRRRREILEVYRHGRMDAQGVDCSQLSELYPGMRLCVVQAPSEHIPLRDRVYN